MTKTINQTLENRIQWVREQLTHAMITQESVDFQWLLQHLISIQECKDVYDFTLDPKDLPIKEEKE